MYYVLVLFVLHISSPQRYVRRRFFLRFCSRISHMLFQKVSFWKGKSAVKHEFIGDVYRAYFLI